MQAAIQTIAEVGYQRASYMQIAQRAGLSSTGLISYHFTSKDDLINQVVATVVADGQAFMLPRIEAASPGSDRLRAYIESNLQFMGTHRSHMIAVAEILSAPPRSRDGQVAPYALHHERGLAQLESYLREGQRIGLMRRFSVTVMSTVIRAAIDTAAYRLVVEPDLDLARYARELADLFDQATAAEPARAAQ